MDSVVMDKEAVNVLGQPCSHVGTVWKIDVICCQGPYCPRGWECSRCGER